MSEIKISEPDAVVKPTADISLIADEKGIIQRESYPITLKENDTDDFLRPVKMSDLKKILTVINGIKSDKIQWDEVAIGVAMLGFGASISALLSDVKIATLLGKIFYILTPIISFSVTVFVVMYKIMKHKTVLYSANTIEEIVENYTNNKNAKDGVSNELE